MGLVSDQDSYSFGDSSLQLLIELIDTDPVHKVSNVIVSGLASEDDCDVEGNKNVVISWASIHRELEEDVLRGDQELDLGPWKAEDKSTALLNMIELSMLGDDCV